MMIRETSLAVIAGGQGRRMGGPKHRLFAHGVPILTYVIDKLAWPGPTLLVLAESDPPPMGSESFQQVIHDRGVGAGPLRAIATALEAAQTPALITIPVDMPGIEQSMLTWLIDGLHQHSDRLGMMLSRGGIIEPFPAIFRAAAAPVLREMLSRGNLALRDLATQPRFAAVTAPSAWNESMWHNLNQPKDLPSWMALPE